MNIQQIRDRYDSENDAHPVTWLEMQLAEEVHKLQDKVSELECKLESLIIEVKYLGADSDTEY